MAPNIKVYRVHRLLAGLYGLLGVVLVGVAVAIGTSSTGLLSALPLLVVLFAISAMHFFTARASREGRAGGRIASRVIACFMLLGFPIGTLIGAYLLVNSRNWPDPNEPRSGEAALDF